MYIIIIIFSFSSLVFKLDATKKMVFHHWFLNWMLQENILNCNYNLLLMYNTEPEIQIQMLLDFYSKILGMIVYNLTKS